MHNWSGRSASNASTRKHATPLLANADITPLVFLMRNPVRPLQRHAAAHAFYHFGQRPISGCACAVVACFAARADRPQRWQTAIDQSPTVYCLGKCYDGPSDGEHDLRPHIGTHARRTVLLGNVLAGGVRDLAMYRERGGGAALARARTLTPNELVRMVHDSGLRGRSGAGFPAAIKWQAVANELASIKYLIVNAGEGDPGAFSDRFLLEDDPFRVIEGAAIAAYAVGASHGRIYLRGNIRLLRR